MMQLNTGNFFGIYLMNSNPSEISLNMNEDNKTTVLTFRTSGGIIDLRFLYGPTFTDVVK